MFVLIIAVDSYNTPGVPPLKHAVSDAEKMRDWVLNKLCIPTNRVKVLLNKAATRRAIIAALNDLAENHEILRNDPILIYFAGHGTEGSPPPSINWDSKIQMILPWDYGHQVGLKRVNGIPDRVLGSLISKVAEAKGNNIVCSHVHLTASHSHPYVDGNIRLLPLGIRSARHCISPNRDGCARCCAWRRSE